MGQQESLESNGEDQPTSQASSHVHDTAPVTRAITPFVAVPAVSLQTATASGHAPWPASIRAAKVVGTNGIEDEPVNAHVLHAAMPVQPPVSLTHVHHDLPSVAAVPARPITAAVAATPARVVTHAEATSSYLARLVLESQDEPTKQDLLATLQKQLERAAEVTRRHQRQQLDALKEMVDMQRRERQDGQANSMQDVGPAEAESSDPITRQAKRARQEESIHLANAPMSLPSHAHDIFAPSADDPIVSPVPAALPSDPLWDTNSALFPSSPHFDPSGDAFQSMRDVNDVDQGLLPPPHQQQHDFDPDLLFANSREDMVSPASSLPSTTSSAARSHSLDALSKVLLTGLKDIKALQALEQVHDEGQFSLVAMRQHIMLINSLLDPDDQEELLASFKQLSMRANESGDAAGATYSSLLDALTQAPLPIFGTDLAPSEPLPDDADGVARLRITMLFSQPPPAAPYGPPSQHRPVMHEKKRKNHHHHEDEEEENGSHEHNGAHTHAHGHSHEHDHHTNHPFSDHASSSALPVATTPTIHHVLQVNRAFEALTGYTQLELANMVRESHRATYQLMRSDHVAAVSKIIMKWRLSNQWEGHLYEVIVTKSGEEKYVLVHGRLNHDANGVLLDGVQSVIPLPHDPAHPPPPFTGEDITEEVVLHGYRPPTHVLATSSSTCGDVRHPVTNASSFS